MNERLSPDMGPHRLFFGGLARPISYGGDILSNAEALEVDTTLSAREESEFDIESQRIIDAQGLYPGQQDTLLAE
jgi:hypothetical protein